MQASVLLILRRSYPFCALSLYSPMPAPVTVIVPDPASG